MLRKVFPLPLIFMVNGLTGLGGMQKISIPMFTVLRRFSIVFAMILEAVCEYDLQHEVKLYCRILSYG